MLEPKMTGRMVLIGERRIVPVRALRLAACIGLVVAAGWSAREFGPATWQAAREGVASLVNRSTTDAADGALAAESTADGPALAHGPLDISGPPAPPGSTRVAELSGVLPTIPSRVTIDGGAPHSGVSRDAHADGRTDEHP
jgi:hypothetical protein